MDARSSFQLRWAKNYDKGIEFQSNNIYQYLMKIYFMFIFQVITIGLCLFIDIMWGSILCLGTCGRRIFAALGDDLHSIWLQLYQLSIFICKRSSPCQRVFNSVKSKHADNLFIAIYQFSHFKLLISDPNSVAPLLRWVISSALSNGSGMLQFLR